MPNTVAQHAVATFTSPVNGSSPIDANTVRGNDNTTRTSYNNHDADPGIHVQSSTLASRPVAGTAGRKWITADAGSYKLWYDDGTTWHEVANTGVDVFVVASEILAKGDVIKVTGYNNGLNAPIVAKVSSASDTAFGIVTGAISNGGTGYITNTGLIADVNTNAFAIGTTLYPNTSGGFTSTKPVAGTYQPVAYVLRSNTNNGVLYVEFSAPRIVERSDNTVSTLVLRDASGNFAAGTVTAALAGNASTATTLQTARNINGVSFNGSADITVTAAANTLTGSTLASGVTASSLTSVGTLTALTVSGAATVGSGTASTYGQLTLNGGNNTNFGALVSFQKAGVQTMTIGHASNTLGGTSNDMLFYNPASAWSWYDTAERMRLDTSGNLAVDTNTLFVDAVNNRVGVGTASPLESLHVVNGAAIVAGSLSSLNRPQSSAMDKLGNISRFFSIGPDASTNGSFEWHRSTTTTNTVSMTLDASGNLAVDTNTLFVDAVNNRVGVGTVTPDGALDVSQGMTNGSTGAFTTPHLALTATSSTDTTGFVGMTMAASDTVNYGWSYGALRSNGGISDLIWKYHFNSAAGTEFLRLTSSGNLGLGVTPSAWAIGKVLQIASAGGAFVYGASGQTILGTNAFFDTSWKYGVTGQATYYEQALGVHSWHTAPSGTAGAAISFTQDMTLASGKLTVNAGAGAYAFQATGTNTYVDVTDTGLATVRIQSSGGLGIFGTSTNHPQAFYTNNAERARIDASGNLGVGTATPSARLHVSGGSVLVNNAFGYFLSSTSYGITGGSDDARLEFVSGNVARMRLDNTTTAGNTSMVLYDVDNGQLERVTVGAADSGGVGFKVLRIPN